MPANRVYLTQKDVSTILAAADAYAEENNHGVVIAVVDDGGHLLGLTRRDGAATISTYIAQEKARASALGRRETKIYEDIINNGRTSFLNATPVLSGTLEGGVNIVVDGITIGAVGVSGVKSADDALTAKAGIAALKL
jgi:glc operon protein GlcG